MDELKGLKVAILVEDGFEQVELVDPERHLIKLVPKRKSCHPRASRSARGTLPNGATPSLWMCHSMMRK